jgi:cyclopentanol dehydrogenase
MQLEGKVAFISGGARGMGAAEARLFAKEGAKVAIGDVLETEGRQVEAEIVEAGGEALFIRLDVTIEEDWRKAIQATVRRFGKLNVLVNNAGVGSPRTTEGEPIRLEGTTREQWDHVLDVNAKGVFLGTKYAIPEMHKAGRGSIINISSIYGMVGSGSGASSYHASKGAVRSFTKAAALQYARDGIRVNSVHLGFIDTPMTERLRSNPQQREDLIRRTPLGRIGTPEDVAYGVLFLASEESSFMTGSELVIDGGYTAE